jgi:hypothetical protein
MSTPMRRTRSPCCAIAASGRAAKDRRSIRHCEESEQDHDDERDRQQVIDSRRRSAMLLMLVVVIATTWSRSERDISPVRAQWRFAGGMR